MTRLFPKPLERARLTWLQLHYASVSERVFQALIHRCKTDQIERQVAMRHIDNLKYKCYN